MSVAAVRAGALPRLFNYLEIVIGAAGLLTVTPALANSGAVFGLSLIVWFVRVGIVVLRSDDRKWTAHPDELSVGS